MLLTSDDFFLLIKKKVLSSLSHSFTNLLICAHITLIYHQVDGHQDKIWDDVSNNSLFWVFLYMFAAAYIQRDFSTFFTFLLLPPTQLRISWRFLLFLWDLRTDATGSKRWHIAYRIFISLMVFFSSSSSSSSSFLLFWEQKKKFNFRYKDLFY